MRQIIARKTFERQEIANTQLAETSAIPLDTFKDPYLLDVLGLHDGYLEADLEAAVLRELESFILELGGGFTFVERQKRMIIDGEDFHLDLLFFHRKLKRLVAVELKIGQVRSRPPRADGAVPRLVEPLRMAGRRERAQQPLPAAPSTPARQRAEALEME